MRESVAARHHLTCEDNARVMVARAEQGNRWGGEAPAQSFQSRSRFRNSHAEPDAIATSVASVNNSSPRRATWFFERRIGCEWLFSSKASDEQMLRRPDAEHRATFPQRGGPFC